MIERVRKDIFDFHNYNSLLKLAIPFLVFFISIAYSVLNSTLMVTGDLVYIAKANIRVTGVRINGTTNGGVEQYSPTFNKNIVTLGMKLPNLDSTATYEVTIKNSSDSKYLISSITDNVAGNPNINYTHNYNNTIIEANSAITVLLTYKYNSDVTSLPESLFKETKIVFVFEETSNTLYDKIKLDYKSGKAELYTGDKSTFLGDKEVYYYKGATTNNNVLFAGFCWKIFRTTETGGVKMIYNGVPDDNLRCVRTGTSATIGNSVYNTNSNSSADAGYMYNKRYVYSYRSLNSIPSYLYGNSFTYSGGTYTLTNTQSVTLSSSTAASLTSKHYTCFNTTGSCTTLSYIFYVSGAMAFYINLTGGTSIEQALNEMLYDDNVNTTNSTMKTTIDTWYKNNMTRYTSYLEDTIWCNDRSMNNQSENGWNPNGGSITTELIFKSEGNTDNLTCQNKNDRFTVSSTNGNGKLTYPVGLVTSQEISLAYYDGNSPINNGASYNWSMSPYSYLGSFGFLVSFEETGRFNYRDISGSNGVRPVVSLRSDIESDNGDGSGDNPYEIVLYKSDKTLYRKMESDYKSGGNVSLYAGDKSTFIGDKEVYYYKGATVNNNVIFAGFCWKMYRTTETGGVKMIYNGVPSFGQCTSSISEKTIGSGAFNPSRYSPAYVGYMYNKVYEWQYKNISTSYLYGNSFIYSEGTYTLTDTQSVRLSSSTYASLNNRHYTCWNASGSCTTLSYVYYLNGSSSAYYVDLTEGTSIEQALNEMLYDDNVNTTNSTIKTTIDTWYENNMTAYTNYLEDTIWCNDRSMSNQSANGWNPNGGSVVKNLMFKSYENTNNLTCQNRNDRFTVSSANGNGKLTYPVGLMTRQEHDLVYYSGGSPLLNGIYFWMMSPYGETYLGSTLYYSYTIGSSSDDFSEQSRYVVPVVSVRSGVKYSSGRGTYARPFVIATD